MAPKKKGGGKVKAAAAAPAGPTRQELQAQIDALVIEKEKEVQARNRAKVERDKLMSCMELKQKDCEAIYAELRMKDREAEELQEKQATEIKVFDAKMKHLLYDQQNIVNSLKADNEEALKLEAERDANRQRELLGEQRDLKEAAKRLELEYEDSIRQMKVDHAKEITKMRQDFDRHVKNLLANNEKQVKQIEVDQDQHRAQQIRELEEHKNSVISELIGRHEKQFTEIKCYYNDVTQNNLDLIKTLKEDVTDMKKKEQANEKLMYEVCHENKRLREPLTRALKEVTERQKQLSHHEQDRQVLHRLRDEHSELLKHSTQLEWEVMAMKDEVENAQAERDDLYARFESCMFDVQQKCGLRSILLEKHVQVLCEELEKKDAQLGVALEVPKMDPTDMTSYGIEEVISCKDQQIKALYFAIGRLSKAYTALMRAFECKLAELGVSLSEISLQQFLR